jgi:alpha-mannosidase
LKSRRQTRVSRREFLANLAAGAAALRGAAADGTPHLESRQNPAKDAYIVPNFHPASCGWLTTFSRERVYCANSYLAHLDRVRDDPTYKFALSEVNNLIAIQNFHPERMDEIRRRAKEGRVELVNAMFLEAAINLSGGEALIKQGVEGLRWQEQVMGVRPRFAWTIDICGLHDQMAQIAAGLGLDALVYCRMNPTGSSVHWIESPDRTRILALCPGEYSEFSPLFSTEAPLRKDKFRSLENLLRQKAGITPGGLPVLVLAGNGDYSLPPRRKEYPQEFLAEWKETNPETRIVIATAGEYLDAVLPQIKSGAVKLPTMRGTTAYTFEAFWIQNPRVKVWYRRNEHGLQSAEALATIASLGSEFQYPVERLYDAWVQMLLNMDRNTLWGAAGGMVFESDTSWDVRDRMESVEAATKDVGVAALTTMIREGDGVALFNPLNWERQDPLILDLPAGTSLGDIVCQSTADGHVLASPRLPSMGTVGLEVRHEAPDRANEISPASAIETEHYTARIDASTGALVSLKLKPSNRELLGGPANVIVAERPDSLRGDPGDFMRPRPERKRLASSSDFNARVTAQAGPLATVVEAESDFFGGGRCRRITRFYHHYPRIDFETELEEIPDLTVVIAEFPLAEEIAEVRRAVPGGFFHGVWGKESAKLPPASTGITPAVGWTDYALAAGAGVAILDRGLSGRELNGRTPIIFLLNAVDKYYGYPNAWLSGKGKHRLEYALVAHETRWEDAGISRLAREYNSPPLIAIGRKPAKPASTVETSNNLIVQAMRREDDEIEVRLFECLGLAGAAEIKLSLPHRAAALTDMRGKNPRPLAGGPRYRFSIRPQQIVTLRFRTDARVEEIKPILAWDSLVPSRKLPALHTSGDWKGLPPRGDSG